MTTDEKQKLHALIKSWRARSLKLQQVHGKKIPIQIQNINDAIEMCASELESIAK